MTVRPVIIIGAARSGTKLLRDLLAESPGAKAVPFDVNYVWRTGNERVPHDALDPDHLTPAARDAIRRTLPKLAGLRPGAEGVLLEKTVSNTLRVPFVAAVYPEARYVHLVRDGRAVAESAVRAWFAPPDWRRLLFKLRRLPVSNAGYLGWYAVNQVRGRLSGRGGGGGVWGPRYPGYEKDRGLPPLEFCARQWAHSVRAAVDDLDRLPAERRFTLRYEDFVDNENRLRELVDWLGLGGADAVVAAYRAEVRPEEAVKWRQALSAKDARRLTEMLRPELDLLGYEGPP